LLVGCREQAGEDVIEARRVRPIDQEIKKRGRGVYKDSLASRRVFAEVRRQPLILPGELLRFGHAGSRQVERYVSRSPKAHERSRLADQQVLASGLERRPGGCEREGKERKVKGNSPDSFSATGPNACRQPLKETPQAVGAHDPQQWRGKEQVRLIHPWVLVEQQ